MGQFIDVFALSAFVHCLCGGREPARAISSACLIESFRTLLNSKLFIFLSFSRLKTYF